MKGASVCTATYAWGCSLQAAWATGSILTLWNENHLFPLLLLSTFIRIYGRLKFQPLPFLFALANAPPSFLIHRPAVHTFANDFI